MAAWRKGTAPCPHFQSTLLVLCIRSKIFKSKVSELFAKLLAKCRTSNQEKAAPVHPELLSYDTSNRTLKVFGELRLLETLFDSAPRSSSSQHPAKKTKNLFTTLKRYHFYAAIDALHLFILTKER